MCSDEVRGDNGDVEDVSEEEDDDDVIVPLASGLSVW